MHHRGHSRTFRNTPHFINIQIRIYLVLASKKITDIIVKLINLMMSHYLLLITNTGI